MSGPFIAMQNENSNRELIETLVQNLEQGTFPSAHAACSILVRNLRSLLVPYSKRISTGSRSGQGIRYGATEFGYERVKTTLAELEAAKSSLEIEHHDEALNLARQALETWKKGRF